MGGGMGSDPWYISGWSANLAQEKVRRVHATIRCRQRRVKLERQAMHGLDEFRSIRPIPRDDSVEFAKPGWNRTAGDAYNVKP